MQIFEQIVLLLIIILIIKGISWIFDSSKPGKPNPDKVPYNINDSEKRKFNWVLEDNIRSHFLSCEISVNKEMVNNAKDELLKENSQPSKLFFTSSNDYFNISRIQILDDRYGYQSYEIEQITEYLQQYASKLMLSNYQFANLILSFVHEQNIKYSYDEDSTGYIEYLRYPLETVYDLTGDCDCKAILACALFKKIGYRVAFAIMPGHAALAITTNSSPFYANLDYNGTKWFYCESTGDNWKPGQLPQGVNVKNISLQEII